jgi:hypothetical protein
MSSGTTKWWGYLHTEGTVQVKRFFDQLDITEANQSPFVKEIVQPFDAASREEAVQKVKQSLGLTEIVRESEKLGLYEHNG